MLSAVIITKNEERNLARCLASLEGIADELVVVDSGSTDGTEKVARSMGARWLSRDWTSYADQKNWATQQANHAYILSLDADEALSDELRQEITDWKRAGNHEDVAWEMPRLTNYIGSWIRHGGWYPDRKIRLWKRGSGSWTAGPNGVELHEAWQPMDCHVAQVGSMASNLLHFSYHSDADHRRKWAHYSTMGAKDARTIGRGSGPMKPWFRPIYQWLKQWVVLGGWRDGKAGWQIARWGALAAHWKWRQVRHPFVLRTVAIVPDVGRDQGLAMLPVAGALKAYDANVEVVWICTPGCESMGQRSAMVDDVRTWRKGHEKDLFASLDAVIFGASNPGLMRLAKQQKVPIRVARGTSWHALKWANRHVWASQRAVRGSEVLHNLSLLHGVHLPARYRYPEAQDWDSLKGLDSSVGLIA